MDFTIAHMWASMGVIAKLVVFTLIIMSIVTLAITAERLVTYSRARKQSREFALAVKDLLAKREYGPARQAASQFQGSHIAPVIGSCLNEYLLVKEAKVGEGFDLRTELEAAVGRTTERTLANMRKGLAALATVGSTAPFVGLFGTTFGIINAFQAMAKEGGGGLGSIAAGIAEALFTTAVGIGVAIVAVLVYNYFTAKVEGLEVDTHDAAGEVVALLVRDHHSTK
ncbi:MotA/TolQ/ExbB proton channel family protein [Myxococcota bacterium]|nr:MotA/TolQ/ExbB proton channel family protein [Myxococcota bacterium]